MNAFGDFPAEPPWEYAAPPAPAPVPCGLALEEGCADGGFYTTVRCRGFEVHALGATAQESFLRAMHLLGNSR